MLVVATSQPPTSRQNLQYFQQYRLSPLLNPTLLLLLPLFLLLTLDHEHGDPSHQKNLSTITTSMPRAAAPFAGRVGLGSVRPPSSPASASSIMGSRKRGGLPSGARAAGDGIQQEAMAAVHEVFEVKGNGGGSARLMTLPTVLTLGRVAAVPILISTFYMNGWWATTATTGIFIAAAITDWLDGYLARKMQLGTVFGAFLDPVADKLMVAATLVLLCTKPLEVSVIGEVNWILTAPSIAIIGREITMSAVREWAASQNTELLEAVAVNNLGKWKTATQMTALTILLATRDPSLAAPDFIVASGVVLLYLSAGLALWSLAVYMRKIWRVLLK